MSQTRYLTDLSLRELYRSLRATEQAAGADSYSARALREAIRVKRQERTAKSGDAHAQRGAEALLGKARQRQ